MPTREGIFKGALRVCVMTLAAFIGVALGLFVLLLLVPDGDQLDRRTTVKILPNAQGERKVLGSSGPVILSIDIKGVVGMDSLTDDKMSSLLVESREGSLKDRVKAILLRVDSPGGTSTDSKAIHDLIQEYKERYKVPVIAHVEGLCASGAMMISAAADKIVACDGSLIGSVGVIMPTVFNVAEVLQKYDVKALTLMVGKDKDVLNPFRPWKADEAATIQPLLDYTYDLFVDLMVKDRPRLNKDKLIHEYGAQMYAANKAAELGYIDEAGYSPSKALELTVEAAKLKGEDYHVVQLTTKTWVTELFQERTSLLSGKITHQIQLNPDVPPELMNKMLYLYLPTGTL